MVPCCRVRADALPGRVRAGATSGEDRPARGEDPGKTRTVHLWYLAIGDTTLLPRRPYLRHFCTDISDSCCMSIPISLERACRAYLLAAREARGGEYLSSERVGDTPLLVCGSQIRPCCSWSLPAFEPKPRCRRCHALSQRLDRPLMPSSNSHQVVRANSIGERGPGWPGWLGAQPGTAHTPAARWTVRPTRPAPGRRTHPRCRLRSAG